MSDDIVTRLRGIVADPKPVFSQQLLSKAADEIERLRAELLDWKKVASYEHAGYCNCCGADENHLLHTLETYVRQA